MDDRALDITLVTNSYKNSMAGAEVLLTEPIVWAGAKGGCAHLREPLPVSLWEEGCAWRAGALEALGREGRNYRVAYMSAHTAGQRSAIMADLAVAPLPKSFLGSDMVELTTEGRPAGDRQLQPGDVRRARRQRAGEGRRRPYPRDVRGCSARPASSDCPAARLSRQRVGQFQKSDATMSQSAVGERSLDDNCHDPRGWRRTPSFATAIVARPQVVIV